MQSRYDSRRSSIPLVKNLSDVFRQTKPYCAAAADTWESVGKLTIFKLQKNASLLQQQRYVNSIFRSSIFGIGRSNYDNDMRGNFSKQTVDHCVYYSRIAWGQSHQSERKNRMQLSEFTEMRKSSDRSNSNSIASQPYSLHSKAKLSYSLLVIQVIEGGINCGCKKQNLCNWIMISLLC